ncbi:lipoate-protein ligase A [Caloramator quimbayensis]|uniref:lipoate--protein ligase n=1 Tax=Caloramator quimbayensis TaxID=1147123 RepID=A0A1T4YAM3_9CLOT|nr:lipoate--protein ligase [Caloramator quimbayensis]SKA98857.1 lipoate-protein ligase A [Caloramator quimbayensis]
MINIINTSNNPYFNLALEEYFLKYKEIDDDLLILWQNEPVIVIGKNQNAYEELNLEYIKNNNIKVVRRLSGGGAVYHDLGNLNFTIIEKDSVSHRNDFKFFTEPVVKCLKYLGVESAEFSGRNDILIEGKKFSGNAQYFYKNKLLHHGTLLFSSDLMVLSNALNVKKEKFESKGIKSVRSRVTNISDYVNISLLQFKELLIRKIFEEKNEEVKNYELTKDDYEKINELVKKKYETFEWNFGQSPHFNYKKELKCDAGFVCLNMNVEEGVIKKVKISGDFFEKEPVEGLEKQFVGIKYDLKIIENIIDGINVQEFILKLQNEDLKYLFY